MQFDKEILEFDHERVSDERKGAYHTESKSCETGTDLE